MLSAISVPPDGSADFLYLHEIGFSSSMKRKAAGDDDKISGFEAGLATLGASLVWAAASPIKRAQDRRGATIPRKTRREKEVFMRPV